MINRSGVRQDNEIWKFVGREYKHKGASLVHRPTLKHINIALKRIEQTQILHKCNKILMPLVCNTVTNPVPKKRRMSFKDIKVNKLHVVRVIVQPITDGNHPFVGKTKKWLVDKVQQELAGAEVNIGIDFDVDCWKQIHKQTFLYDHSDIIKVGHKVRILILFEDEGSAALAYAMLNKCKSELLPWTAHISSLKQDKLYAESELQSMLAQWLTCLDLTDVE